MGQRKEINDNIRRLPTRELRTYNSAYRKGQIYKSARNVANAELRRRQGIKIQPRTRRKVRQVRSNPFEFRLPSFRL